MSLKGWGIALLLSPFTLGFSLIIYFYIWFFGKIGKFYIKAMTFSIKAAVGIIAWPFKALASAVGGTFHFFELMYYQGVHNIKSHDNTTYAQNYSSKETEDSEDEDDGGVFTDLKSGFSFISTYKFRYIGLFLAIIMIFNFPSTILALVQDPTSLLSLSGFIDFIPTLLLISVPFIITIFISALSFEFLGDGTKFYKASDQAVVQAKKLGSTGAAAAGAAAGGAAAAGQAARGAAGAGLEAKDMAETAVTSASHIETASGMIGGEAAAGEAAAGEAAAGEAAAAEGLGGLVAGSSVASALGTAAPVIVVLLLAWIVYTLIAGVISLILVVLTWGFIGQFVPLVAGPVMGAIGLGGAYANWFGGEAANSGAALSIMQGDAFSEEKRALAQAGAKMQCMLKGPQCLRQWQMNNTVRPGSEARGETYELQISQFGLGTESIDVAYKESDYELPVNFLVENTRNGLKGINARNVSYKINIMDSKKTYCSTGWKKVSSFDDESRNYILPGLGVSPVESLEQLNLGECGLLQPSLGVNRVMELQVRYNYASQATLYVDAMSRENRREQGIEPGFKKSETAKTPVQSYINVNSPITFYETEGGDRNAVPFAARFGFETPGMDVRYRIRPDSIQIADSSVTTNTSTCNGLQRDKQMGENYYEISERAKERINLRQENSWFDADTQPAPLRCTMKINEDDLGQISPTGEQLVMRIDGNYTVVKEDRMTGFDVKNTLCSRNNCPLLVTSEYSDQSKYEHLYSECTSSNSVDTRGGCSIRMPNGSDMNWRMPSLAERNGKTVTIDQGKVARRLDSFLADPGFNFSGDTQSTSNFVDGLKAETTPYREGSPVPIGAPKADAVQSEIARSQGLILYEEANNPNNVEVGGIDLKVCSEEKDVDPNINSDQEAANKFMKLWAGAQRTKVNPLKISVEVESCQDSISRYIADSAQCGINQYVNMVDASLQFYNPTDSVDEDQFDEQACEGVAEQVRSCTGVLTKERGGLECYGGTFE